MDNQQHETGRHTSRCTPTTSRSHLKASKFRLKLSELIPGTNTTVEISGSCVGKLERTEFWVFLILSSMTQYAGTKTGFLFDQRIGKNMEPLLGIPYPRMLARKIFYGSNDGSWQQTFRYYRGRAAARLGL